MKKLKTAIALLSATIMLPDAAFAGTDSYLYDALGRVISVIHANGTTTSYAYDAAGNRTSVVTAANTAVTWNNFNWNNAAWHN